MFLFILTQNEFLICNGEVNSIFRYPGMNRHNNQMGMIMLSG